MSIPLAARMRDWLAHGATEQDLAVASDVRGLAERHPGYPPYRLACGLMGTAVGALQTLGVDRDEFMRLAARVWAGYAEAAADRDLVDYTELLGRVNRRGGGQA